MMRLGAPTTPHECAETWTAAEQAGLRRINDSKTRLHGMSTNGVLRLAKEHLAC